MARKVSYTVGANLGSLEVVEHVIYDDDVKKTKKHQTSSKVNTKGKNSSSRKYTPKGNRNK